MKKSMKFDVFQSFECIFMSFDIIFIHFNRFIFLFLVYVVLSGDIVLQVQQVNADEGEIGGVFVSTQATDTDQGTKAPKKVLTKGIFYGQVETL